MRQITIFLFLLMFSCGTEESTMAALPGEYSVNVDLPNTPPGPGKDAILSANYALTVYENGTAGFTVDAGSGMVNNQLWEWSISGDSIFFDKPNGERDRYSIKKTQDGWTMAKQDQIFNLKRQ